MTLKIVETAVVDPAGGGEATSIASLLTLSGTANPAYLIVNALDRNEYTVASTDRTGYFSGGGAALNLGNLGGDARGVGIVYAWQAASGQYVNGIYGSLSQLTYTDSASANDITNISFFGTSSPSIAQAYASNAYALMQADPTGYLGSTTFATNATLTTPPPPQATPDGVAATAMSLVGHVWNNEGCWVLASTIAALSGAGLPIQSTALHVAGVPSGEWVTIYNGPAGSSGDWQSLVSTGDIVAFATSAASGHITTCVSGIGSTAMLVDNITYLGAYGGITNSAHDGSGNDIVIASPHAAAQEFAGVAGSSVVIYALDTPAITDRTPIASLNTNATISLATLFSATDPGHKTITSYQVYEQNSADTVLLSGKSVAASSADTAVVSASLSTLSLLAGTSLNADTLDIRASNGSDWGDWQTIAVNVTPAPVKPPVLTAQTAAQTWQQGAKITFALPSTLFRDPAGSALTYSAQAAGGAVLPSWLSFDPSTLIFSGTVPAGLERVAVVVTATDALGASASERFAVTVPATTPVLAVQEPTQFFMPGQAVGFALPSGSFIDPQGQTLTLHATLATGAVLPSWLHFTAATGSFAGTAPANAQTLSLKVTATDNAGLSGSEVFSLAAGTAGVSGLSLDDWNAAATLPIPNREMPASAGSVGAFSWSDAPATVPGLHHGHG